jgi:hypothetical protein
MADNVDVIFYADGTPVNPNDLDTILNHVRSLTNYDEEGIITGYRSPWDENPYGPGGMAIYTDIEFGGPGVGTDEFDIYGEGITISKGHLEGNISGFVYNSVHYGNTPLDKAKLKIYNDRRAALFGGRTRQITQLSGSGNTELDENIAKSIPETWLQRDRVFDGTAGEQYTFAEKGMEGVKPLIDVIADIDGNGTVDQADVLEFIKNVKKGDVTIFYESVPNSVSNNGAGGYRGVINVPVKDAEVGSIQLFFDAPDTYKREILTKGLDQDGFYGDYDADTRVLKGMTYDAQVDLDRALRVPGSIVPSSTLDANGQPIGYYYFGINPIDGKSLNSDQYMFVPNKNIITKIDVGEHGEIIETRSDGTLSFITDVDDNPSLPIWERGESVKRNSNEDL